MYIVIITSLLALYLTYLESQGRKKNGMKLGFILLTILASIHYDYGNDYMSYYELSKSLENIPWDFRGIMEGDYYREPGWVIINKLFSYVGGFFTLVTALSIFQGVVFYRFIKNNVDKKWWWMGMYIYAICTSFYVVNFSMLRQGFAVTVFLACYPLIKHRSLIGSLIAAGIMYLTSFAHHSALLTIPFCFWSFLPVKNGKLWCSIYVVVFIMMYLSSNFLNAILEPLFTADLAEEYLNTYERSDSGFTGGIGWVLLMLPFVVSMSYLFNSDDDQKRSLVMLSAISTMISPIAMIVPLAGRMGIYFSIFSIAAFPIAYSSIPNKQMRQALIGLYLLITTFDYYKFFFIDPTWAEHYRVFHTIFEVLS